MLLLDAASQFNSYKLRHREIYFDSQHLDTPTASSPCSNNYDSFSANARRFAHRLRYGRQSLPRSVSFGESASKIQTLFTSGK